MSRHAAIKGAYVYTLIDAVEHRLYYEEAGQGIPLVLQHTAATDGRQWRHLMEDPEITRRFRVIAPDCPFHGKSLPPSSVPWWTREYRLTKDFFESYILAFCESLELDRPVFMGCSMGGHLAIDLAIDHPDAFRAVIGLEAGLETKASAPPKLLDWFNHPRVSNEFKSALMFAMMAPTSPEEFRRETGFVYSQSAPTVFKGDLHYYTEHDVRETARSIDTRKTRVYVMGGEYDWSGTPAVCQALVKEVNGAHYTEMKGLGHFPMCENPSLFLEYLRPILDEIQQGSNSGGRRTSN